MIIKASISDLKIGHFVIDIVEQHGSYNLTRAGHIKNNSVISSLKAKGVASVLVDTAKTIGEALSVNLPEQHEKSGPIIFEVARAKKYLTIRKSFKSKFFSMYWKVGR